MKLSRHTFQTFWSVHAWAGVLAGLVLHVIFFTGVLVLFRSELAAWQDPAAAVAPERARVMAPRIAGRMAAAGALDGAFVDIGLPTPERPVATIIWTAPGASEARTMRLSPDGGRPVAERSRLAEFLFHLHFLWHDDVPQLLWVTGILGVLLLLVLVTGLLIHLPSLGRQLFRFRAHRAARARWSALHKVLGTWGLPIQAMFAFTGAYMCLSALLLPGFVGPVFDGDRGAAERALYGDYQVAPARGAPGPMLPLDQIVDRAEGAAGMRAERVRIHHWGDADSTAVVYGRVGGRVGGPEGRGPAGLYPHAMVKLRAADGAVLHVETPDTLPPAQALSHTLYGLHFARYGGLAVKLLYALLGLAGCATILSGNALWLARREARRAHPGNRLLARLTAAAGGGLALAVAALFLSNRLLPLGWAGRADAEIQIFFGAWALAGVACLIARDLRALWIGLLGLAGALLVLVPIVGLALRPAGLLALGALHGHPATLPVALVDLVLLGLGSALAVAAHRVQRMRGVS